MIWENFTVVLYVHDELMFLLWQLGHYFLYEFAFGFSSSALVEAAWLLLTVFSPCRRHVFLLSEEKGGKETDTEAFFAPI